MKTVIFDMDGVIVDSEHTHCKAWIKAYKSIGINIDEKYYYNKIQGQHGMQSTKSVLREFNKDENQDNLILKKEMFASKLICNEVHTFPGAIELINDLYDRGYKLGLASGSGMQVVNKILSQLSLEDRFMVVHGGQAVSNGKPFPEVYLKTADLLESDPEECVVIEDSKSGIISAKSSGMKCIGVLNGRNKIEDLLHADKIVNSVSEITYEMIEEI